MRNEKILVIEDDSCNLELTTDLLEAGGYAVLSAINAEDGIALAQAEKPDLILMDAVLPGMDGLMAIEVLRADPRTKTIGVVILSSRAMKEDHERARAAGSIGYITKPVDTREFVTTVSNLIASHKGPSI